MRRIAPWMCALGLAASACSATTPRPPDESGSPSPTVSSSPSPSASPTPRAPRAASAAYVAEGGVWIYDVKTDSVSEIARGEGIRAVRWVSRNQLSFVQPGSGGADVLRLLDTRTSNVRDVLTVPTGIRAYGWSPDRQMVAYVTVGSDSYPHLYFQPLVGEGAPMPVTTLARVPGRERTPADQELVAFSADGEKILVVFTPAEGGGEPLTDDQSPLQVRGLDGALLYAAAPGRHPTMGVWSADGTRAFYRSDRGTFAWTAATGRVSRVPGDPRWFDPSPSKDGKRIAYDTGATAASVSVRAVDLRTGKKTSVSGDGFFHPIDADARTIWAQRVQPCEPDCLQPVVPGPEVVAFDVVKGTQRTLALPTLVDADVLFR